MKDEWDADMLHVIYDMQKITAEQLIERIAQEGFEAELKRGS